MSEWREITLGDYIKTNNESISVNYPYKRILYLDTGSITSGRIQKLQEMDLSNAPSRAKRLVRENDIVYSAVRPNQRHFGFMKNPQSNLVVSTGFIVISCDSSQLFPRYLFYYLTSDRSVEYLHSIAEGSTSAYPSLKPTDVETLRITLPPLEEQRAIAEILSALDDKIDLLHRQNQTMEALASTLFRQWFIEEAEDCWEEDSLFEAIVLLGGGTPKTSEERYWDGEIPWLSGSDISANHKSFVNSTAKTISQEGLDHSSTKLLPKFSTVITARGTVGKYCILAEPMAFSQTNYGIMPKLENCFFFTYLLIDHSVEELMSAAYGSVFDTITTRTFLEFQINIPPDYEIFVFEEQVRPYFQKMKQNQDQIQLLEKLRDTLLPKLMSGEVRVQQE